MSESSSKQHLCRKQGKHNVPSDSRNLVRNIGPSAMCNTLYCLFLSIPFCIEICLCQKTLLFSVRSIALFINITRKKQAQPAQLIFSTTARWRSNRNVSLVVGRSGAHSLSRVIPEDFEKMVFTASLLGAQHKKVRDSVQNKPVSLRVVSLGKPLNWTPPPLCGGQMACSCFTRLQL